MKTFIYDKIERLKKFKLTIDVKSALCRTPWLVPNDEGKRIEYIFKHDGTIVMSTNGIVSYGGWTFEPLIMALFIKCNDVTMNFKPIFYDDNLLALNLDGTNSLLFLVNQVSQVYVNSIDYKKSVAYLDEKEQENNTIKKEEERKKRLAESDYLNSSKEIAKQYNIYYNLHKVEIDSLKKERNRLLLFFAGFFIFMILLNVISYFFMNKDISFLVNIVSIVIMVVAYYRVMLKILHLYENKGIFSKSDFCDSMLEDRLKLINKEDLLN